MSEQINIPKHWQIKKLGEICDITYGKGLPVKQLKPNGYPVFGANGIIGFNDKYLFEDPQVLISCRGAASGKINLSPAKCYVTNNSLVLNINRKEDIDKNYLFYALTIAKKTKLVTGTAQPQVTINNAIELEIPFPPYPEQQAIVSKIEELLSDLENGKQQLLLAQQLLKVYQQSLLKVAFEGKLTNHNLKEGEFPVTWSWVRLGDILESVKNGYGKKPDDEGRKKILRISSVRPNSVDLTDIRYLKNDLPIEYEVFENDLLFTRYNGSKEYVGVCARVPSLREKVFYPDKLIRCRPKLKEHFHSIYLQYASNCGESRKYIVGKLKTTAGQTGIAGSEIKQIPIPLAPLNEQKEIVEELEMKLAISNKIGGIINLSLQQTELLRHSILEKAFEGKLIPN